MTRPPVPDLVVDLLSAGPADAASLAARLAAGGDAAAPVDADGVAMALRGDPRVVALPDGRWASLAAALQGAVLTVRLEAAHLALDEIPVDGDLAPLMAAGLDRGPRPPAGVRAGEIVAVHVVSVLPLGLRVERLSLVAAAGAALEALGAAVRDDDLGDGRPPLPVHLAAAGLTAMADRPDAFRRPGRPLGELVGDLGLEVRHGWVAPPQADWDTVARLEAGLLVATVEDGLAIGAAGATVGAQGRLVRLVGRALPAGLPGAVGRLQALRADADPAAAAPVRAVAARAGSQPSGRAADHYLAVRDLLARGDTVAARRAVESGLARSGGAGCGRATACLADIGHDLDARAALARIPRDPARWLADPAGAARAAAALPRSYLIERLAWEMLDRVGEDAFVDLLAVLETAGPRGPETAAALAMVLPGACEPLARRLIATARPSSSSVAALIEAAPVAAWVAPARPDRPGVWVVAVGKEQGRVMPFVARAAWSPLGPALVGARFGPDLAPPRLVVEVLDTLPHPAAVRAVAVREAVSGIEGALGMAVALRAPWAPGREERLVDRVERWLLRPLTPDWPRPGA